MYAEFFGLRELPFNNTPDPRFFYSTPDHEEALASLAYTVQQRKGFVLLTGEVGTGKTLISRLMLRQFSSRIAFAHINHGVPSAADLLEAICSELEIPVEAGETVARLIRRLHDFLLARFAQDVPVVLVLDEAQNLPDEAFELIRTIGNLEADEAKLFQIVIVGQPELQERFASPSLRQLRQRIFRSFHLSALNRAATEAYIRFRLEVAGGGKRDVFLPDALSRIYDYSQGLPRLINTLCDNALLSAYSADLRTIDGLFLQSVVDQLMMNTRTDPRTPPRFRSSDTRPAVSRAPACPPQVADNLTNRQTFEKLSRIVDELEHRIAAQQPPIHGRHDACQNLDAAIVRAGEVGESLRAESLEHRRQLQTASAQLKETIRHIRSSFDGARTLLAEIDERKREVADLRRSVESARHDVRTLLGEVKGMQKENNAVCRAAPTIVTRRTLSREAVTPSTVGQRHKEGVRHTEALRDVSRGVAALRDLAEDCRTLYHG